MSKSIWSVLRTIGLVVMIVSASVADIWLFFIGGDMLIWAWFWLTIILLVGGFEIFSYATKKKTISTIWKEYAQKHRVIASVLIGILAVSLLGLWVHLLVW
jgi:hypothetical protein